MTWPNATNDVWLNVKLAEGKRDQKQTTAMQEFLVVFSLSPI